MNEPTMTGILKLEGSVRFLRACQVAASNTDLFAQGSKLKISQRNGQVKIMTRPPGDDHDHLIFDDGRFFPHGVNPGDGMPTVVGRYQHHDANYRISICLIARQTDGGRNLSLLGIVEGDRGAGSWVSEEEEETRD